MAEQLAKVGDVIQGGEQLPDNVTGVLDCDGDELVLNALGHWHSPSASDATTCSREGACGVAPLVFTPLTVTAIRDPDRKCPGCGERPHHALSCIEARDARAEPDEVTHYRIPGDASATTLCGEDVWDESTSVTERAGSSNCVACRAAAGEDAPKSQTVRVTMALGIDDRDGKAVISTHHLGEIGSCDRQVFLDAVAETFGVVLAPQGEEVDRLRRLLKTQAENFAAATDKLIAERDDARRARDFLAEQVVSPSREALDAVGVDGGLKLADRILTLANQRDAARAEVERLKSAGALTPEEGRALYDAWRADQAARAEPVVLTLPQVPDGAVALRGHGTGRRAVRHPSIRNAWVLDDDLHLPEAYVFSIGLFLNDEGSVTVEMAPPREPRTWNQLDGAPADIAKKLEVRQPDGPQFVVALRTDGRWASTIAFPNPENAEPHETYAWSELLGEGDVTEVFDEPGGQQR